MIIDKNYEGLIFKHDNVYGQHYFFEDDMIIKEDVTIKLDKLLIIKGHQIIEGYQR